MYSKWNTKKIMFAITPELRTIIWILTGISTILLAILIIILESNLAFFVRRLIPKMRKQGGRPPTEKPFVVWFLFSISAIIMITGTAIASSAPEAIPSEADNQSSISNPTLLPPENTPNPEIVLSTATQVPTSTNTITPILTSTNAPELPTSIPTLGNGSIMSSNKDGMVMVYVPSGEFLMGNDDAWVHSQPSHKIYLDSFWIDRTEVTNKMYSLCVAKKACQPPNFSNSNTRESYYDNPKFDNYPVIYVSWHDAYAYCFWAGRRLPTEAEWEKTASWDPEKNEKRTFPWGNSIDCSYANYWPCGNYDTTKVGHYQLGASYYGALDMAGNVFEWVSDWYSDNYYQYSPPTNPLGPNSGQERVWRGGAIGINAEGLRSWSRWGRSPDNSRYSLGFRCARSE